MSRRKSKQGYSLIISRKQMIRILKSHRTQGKTKEDFFRYITSGEVTNGDGVETIYLREASTRSAAKSISPKNRRGRKTIIDAIDLRKPSE